MKPFHHLRNALRCPLRQTLRSPPFRQPPAPHHHHPSPLTRGPPKRPYTTKPPYNPTPTLNSPTPTLSLSQRLRKLSREYGWSAFGVYMLFTALDFPFCFAAVRYLGADRAEKRNHGENASIWTQLALAYAIHKSFIFIRVPLTVAATPKVVKVLRGWGWDIGKRRPKG
ncbi:hypothetical protein BDR22DRAFT_438268 [Usnea florida]